VQEQDSASRVINLAGAILGLIYLLWAMWTLMLPEPTRREWKLRIVLSCAQVTTRIARRAAEGSMAREVMTGQANYELPYALMSASERLMDTYRRMTL
jgi:membrane-anchored protein YejM (alkaline phosphatase superfamily)